MTRGVLINAREYKVTSAAVDWYKDNLDADWIDAFEAGADWQYGEFEKNRLAACDKQTEEEAKREMEFVTGFIKAYNRVPTFTDAIETTRRRMIAKACGWLTFNIGMLLNGLGVEYDKNKTDIHDFLVDFKKAMEEQI